MTNNDLEIVKRHWKMILLICLLYAFCVILAVFTSTKGPDNIKPAGFFGWFL